MCTLTWVHTHIWVPTVSKQQHCLQFTSSRHLKLCQSQKVSRHPQFHPRFTGRLPKYKRVQGGQYWRGSGSVAPRSDKPEAASWLFCPPAVPTAILPQLLVLRHPPGPLHRIHPQAWKTVHKNIKTLFHVYTFMLSWVLRNLWDTI